MATTTITVNGVSYDIDDFDVEKALAGNTLFASDMQSTPTYYPVTEFKAKISKDNYAVEYNYQAKIQNQTWKFNEFGEELHGNYQLYIGSATIVAHQAGDNVSDGTAGATGTTYYNLTSLNYRETVALQTLNAMIFHVPDPISYDDAAIKLLIQKAFSFSEEFMSQAMKKRTENATYDNGQITPDANASPEEILINISNSINQIKSAFMTEAVGTTPANNVLNELTQIKTQQQNIATALSGSGTGLATQVAQIVSNTAAIEDALIDNTDPNNPVNRIDNMASAVSGQSSNITDIKNNVSAIRWYGTDDSNSASMYNMVSEIRRAMYTDTSVSPGTIRKAGESLWELEQALYEANQTLTDIKRNTQ